MAKGPGRTAAPKPQNGLKRLEERLAKASKRSDFGMYLKGHFDSFTALIGKYGARWEEIAQWAQDEGLTGGKPIKPVTAKKAYDREKKRRAEEPKPKRRGPAQPAAANPAVRFAQNVPAKAPLPAAVVAPGPAEDDPLLDDIRQQMRESQGWLKKPAAKKRG